MKDHSAFLGAQSKGLRQLSKIRDAVLYAKQPKVRSEEHVVDMNDNRWTRAVSYWISRDAKCAAGRPPTQWSEFFAKSLEESYDAQRVPRASRAHWTTLARDMEKWKIYWRPLKLLDDQQDYSLAFLVTSNCFYILMRNITEAVCLEEDLNTNPRFTRVKRFSEKVIHFYMGLICDSKNRTRVQLKLSNAISQLLLAGGVLGNEETPKFMGTEAVNAIEACFKG
ncbi:unnamed protein product [Angiostrongylus costaricensis]|uniref:NR LBD domain-containing protein n=1 Tax=Angiostrongylus costaricensis TaxID=334426 RepID=A0A0R3PIE0_ANGCS|nr:unnamed protein product [Angiostrongylus costaricensis]